MNTRRVILIAASLSLAYLAIQAAYISRLPLVMDEFDGANEAYQLLSATPYQDFRPYKTVLGYYIEVPALLLTSDPWTGVMLSKAWLALINTACIFGSTLALATIFTPASALLAQVMLVFMTTFLERSSELRVDMLTAWFGLASFLLLLKRRWFAAGLVGGLSFIVSQKGIYYLVAANAAAGIFWLVDSRDRRTFRDLIVLNAGMASVIALYIAIWGLVSAPWTVIEATFLRSGDIAFGQLYDLEEHWTRTLTHNPLFYGGALIGILALAVARYRGRVTATHLMAASYAAVVFALCRWHKQPWPYFFVILIPTLMVAHAATLDLVWRTPRWRQPAVAVIALLGVVFPLFFMQGILARDNSYQQRVVRMAHAMLDEGDTYLAGLDLIYDRAQAHTALRRLSAPRLEAVRQWPDDRVDEVIADLERTRPKLLIDDVRMQRVAPRLRRYFQTRFDRLALSINGYAPLVTNAAPQFEIWFDGEYRVEPSSGDAIIDGVRHAAGSMVTLAKGTHRLETAAPVRLRLIPPTMPDVDATVRYQRMFARAYDY